MRRGSASQRIVIRYAAVAQVPDPPATEQHRFVRTGFVARSISAQSRGAGR